MRRGRAAVKLVSGRASSSKKSKIEDLNTVEKYKGDPVLTFENATDWSAWLEVNHEKEGGHYLRIGNKKGNRLLLSYDEALKTALCWGWIDGHCKSVDEHHRLQRFSRRRKKSNWSDRNKGIAEKLVADGLMKEPGASEIARAKEDGRWN